MEKIVKANASLHDRPEHQHETEVMERDEGIHVNRDNTVFCSARLYQGGVKLWVKGDPKTLGPSQTFARDVSKIGHWGNGNIELSISDLSRLPTAEPLIRQSFENATNK